MKTTNCSGLALLGTKGPDTEVLFCGCISQHPAILFALHMTRHQVLDICLVFYVPLGQMFRSVTPGY